MDNDDDDQEHSRLEGPKSMLENEDIDAMIGCHFDGVASTSRQQGQNDQNSQIKHYDAALRGLGSTQAQRPP